ncbi:MAG: SurA N-terminal domain-containing protein [Spirochaetales bacterium]|nr:SurA N-terminal domain-containing protein [Spirochaetales bacterium]
MKKKTLLMICLILIVTGTLFAQIDKAVARFKYSTSNTEVIYLNKFKDQIQAVESQYKRVLTVEERKQLLEQLIDEKLMAQAAKEAGIVVTETEIENKLNQVKSLIEMQYKQKISNDDFKKILESKGTDWDEFMEQIRVSALNEKYKMSQNQGNPKKSTEITKADVEEYYNENRQLFVSQEMIKIKQIFIITKGLTEEQKTEAENKAYEIEKALKSGVSFDDYNKIYLTANPKEVGATVIETWTRNDESRKITYGKDFYNSVFKLEKGVLSKVLESELGLHIIQVLEKYPFKILELDNMIPPTNVLSVRQQIETAIKQQREMETYQAITDKLVSQIKTKSDIKIFEENLQW